MTEGQSDTIEIKKSYLVVAVVAIIVFIVGFYLGGALNPSGGSAGVAAQPAGNAGNTGGSGGSDVRVQVSLDDDAVKGDPDAPVTIVEFSDFECPFCARFYSGTLPQIESEYIDTGKVKLVYRDYPLDTNCNPGMSRQLHPNACKAAEAAECAHEQGKFWEMHDTIFENQKSISTTDLKGYAADLGLDTTTFNDCLDTGKYESEVANDLKDGSSYGVGGTPAFFVNGILISGAQPFSVFKATIDAELA